MSTITEDILEMANDDMVSHGLIAQCLKQANTGENSREDRVEDVLKELLTSDKVEMGSAKATTADYVEFVAWRGTIEEKVSRAMEAVATANGPDKEFAYWLCLPENVDRFEGDDE